jgi:hypothetical protein
VPAIEHTGGPLHFSPVNATVDNAFADKGGEHIALRLHIVLEQRPVDASDHLANGLCVRGVKRVQAEKIESSAPCVLHPLQFQMRIEAGSTFRE